MRDWESMTLEEKYKAMCAVVRRLSEDCVKSEAARKELEDKLTAKTYKIKDLCERSYNDYTSLLAEHYDLENELDNCKKELNIAAGNIATLKEERNTATGNVMALHEQIYALQNQLKSALEETNSVKAEYAAKFKALQEDRLTALHTSTLDEEDEDEDDEENAGISLYEYKGLSYSTYHSNFYDCFCLLWCGSDPNCGTGRFFHVYQNGNRLDKYDDLGNLLRTEIVSEEDYDDAFESFIDDNFKQEV